MRPILTPPETGAYRKAGVIGLWLFLVCLSPLQAKPLSPPADPTQSITYWRKHTLSADEDSLAAMAQGVFRVLLRAWDSSRVEPGLYVVKSSAGPWAASLADGNILLSRSAIETCLKFGKHRAEHLLAFVLAHELAHQRADDLWHQRFFRLIGEQDATIKQLVDMDRRRTHQDWSDVGQKETQADHDGLIMMSSVGYDPYQVLDKKDFFTLWVESIWGESCESQTADPANSQACRLARRRATRTHAQLTAVATQSTLYEMGVQSFIAGDYKTARRYFTAYGRDYTHRTVLSALGLTHFAEALTLYRQLQEDFGLNQPAYYYPLLLDAHVTLLTDRREQRETAKRTALAEAMARVKKKMQDNLDQSINYYEKAIRLEPYNARTYLLLAFSYLLGNNTYMVRGIIQGKYIPRFGRDDAASLILAMTDGMEGKTAAAEQTFDRLIKGLRDSHGKTVIPVDLVVYSTYYNAAAYAEYRGNRDKAARLWQQLAADARSTGKATLFQLAVRQVRGGTVFSSMPASAPTVEGRRLGDRFSTAGHKRQEGQESDLWIEGEKYQVYRFSDGSRYVVDAGRKIAHAWQDAGRGSPADHLAIGDTADRVLKIFGIPDRQVHMMSGEYLAYDAYGLALHLVQDRLAGWFLYYPR